MTEKEFVGPDALLRGAFLLAAKIFDSGFRPDVLLVVWRGGTPIGIAIHEFLRYKGIETYHAALKAESYTGIGQQVEPRIEHLDSMLPHVKADSRVLLVDDIFDTGRTLAKVKGLLAPRVRDVRIATLYYKESQNLTGIVPDFFLHKTDRWIVFPHELMDLTPDELRQKDPFLHQLILADQPAPPA